MGYLDLPENPIDSRQFQAHQFLEEDVSGTKNISSDWFDITQLGEITNIFPLMSQNYYSATQNIFPEKVASKSDQEKFDKLVANWKSETSFNSSLSGKIINPHYLRIIGMGRTAVPLIIQELRENPDHFFVALVSITGEDPVPEADKGNISKMAATWINWAESNL